MECSEIIACSEAFQAMRGSLSAIFAYLIIPVGSVILIMIIAGDIIQKAQGIYRFWGWRRDYPDDIQVGTGIEFIRRRDYPDIKKTQTAILGVDLDAWDVKGGGAIVRWRVYK